MSHRAKTVVEPLEPRLLMSGTVWAKVMGDTLVLRGDDADNAVCVYVQDGRTYVVGQDSGGQTFLGTNKSKGKGENRGKGKGENKSKDGSEEARSVLAVFDGIKGIRVQMMGGNDVVEVGQFDLSGAARFDLGDGDDQLVITDGRFSGRVRVMAHGGDDVIAIGAPMAIPTNLPAGAVTFGAGLSVLTGGGTDAVYAQVVSITGHGFINMGASEQDKEIVALGYREGMFEADRLTVIAHGETQVVIGNLEPEDEAASIKSIAVHLSSSDGDDKVVLRCVDTVSLKVLTGDGDDTVRIFEDTEISGQVQVLTGDGDDRLYVGDATLSGTVMIDMGDGDDVVAVRNVTIDSDVDIQGGLGDLDRIYFYPDLDPVVAEHVIIEGFETIA